MADPGFIDLTPEMRERLEKFRDEHDGEELGGVGTRLLLEDDRLKIWELILEPGEASPLHKHEHDYYLAIKTGDLIAGVPPKSSGLDPYVAAIPPGGMTAPVPRGGTEWAVNVGKETYSEILIEYKDQS